MFAAISSLSFPELAVAPVEEADVPAVSLVHSGMAARKSRTAFLDWLFAQGATCLAVLRMGPIILAAPKRSTATHVKNVVISSSDRLSKNEP